MGRLDESSRKNSRQMHGKSLEPYPSIVESNVSLDFASRRRSGWIDKI